MFNFFIFLYINFFDLISFIILLSNIIWNTCLHQLYNWMDTIIDFVFFTFCWLWRCRKSMNIMGQLPNKSILWLKFNWQFRSFNHGWLFEVKISLNKCWPIFSRVYNWILKLLFLKKLMLNKLLLGFSKNEP